MASKRGKGKTSIIVLIKAAQKKRGNVRGKRKTRIENEDQWQDQIRCPDPRSQGSCQIYQGKEGTKKVRKYSKNSDNQGSEPEKLGGVTEKGKKGSIFPGMWGGGPKSKGLNKDRSNATHQKALCRNALTLFVEDLHANHRSLIMQ